LRDLLHLRQDHAGVVERRGGAPAGGRRLRLKEVHRHGRNSSAVAFALRPIVPKDLIGNRRVKFGQK